MTDELSLLRDADARAAEYLETVSSRRVFPSGEALAELQNLAGPLSENGCAPNETLALLDRFGTPATVTSNGPNYYGFVIGATLPAAAAAERLAAAWDQCASSFANSPVAAALEKTAGAWLLDILDLPRGAGVGFGTSATACGLGCLAAARKSLLAAKGWDVDARGISGAPTVRVVVPASVHVTVKKALRLLGFGLDNIIYAPVDGFARIDPAKLPPLDEATILCLQAGEVNTGEFDLFTEIIPVAKAAGAWVHVDGAFGLWARASTKRRHLTEGVDGADSWTTDGHKWLNTPYDGAVAICRDKKLMAQTMNADAAYSEAEADAQKNLTLEFSRRARGIPIWAALHSLGRKGVEALVDQFCDNATALAEGLRGSPIEILNRVVLNQILCRLGDDEKTKAFVVAAQNSGEIWFGPSVWEGRAAFRLSISSWRTEPSHIEAAACLLSELAARQA
jgi:glutamate/tyrosine decarboxylase-like PLP-dependent enzyme